MDQRLTGQPRVCCRVEEEPLPVPEWYYVYRWDVSPCHLSGREDMQGLYDSVGAAAAAAGAFTLRPHWRQDYAALVATEASRCRAWADGRR